MIILNKQMYLVTLLLTSGEKIVLFNTLPAQLRIFMLLLSLSAPLCHKTASFSLKLIWVLSQQLVFFYFLKYITSFLSQINKRITNKERHFFFYILNF